MEPEKSLQTHLARHFDSLNPKTYRLHRILIYLLNYNVRNISTIILFDYKKVTPKKYTPYFTANKENFKWMRNVLGCIVVRYKWGMGQFMSVWVLCHEPPFSKVTTSYSHISHISNTTYPFSRALCVTSLVQVPPTNPVAHSRCRIYSDSWFPHTSYTRGTSVTSAKFLEFMIHCRIFLTYLIRCIQGGNLVSVFLRVHNSFVSV